MKWVRRYNEAGEFIMEMASTDEARKLIKAGTIIYKGMRGEAAFIEDYIASRNAAGLENLQVTGRFLNSILDRRVINLTMSGPLKDVVNAILNQNFISPADAARRIPQMRLLNYNLSNNPAVNVDYKNISALEAVSELCKGPHAGFKVVFNIRDSAYDFTLYEGAPTHALFTENYFNVLEQDYYYKTAQEKTTCYVDANGQLSTAGGEASGLLRKEMYISADTQSEQSALQQGRAALLSSKRVESFDTVLNMDALQFAYGEDWDLGDIVKSESLTWQKSITQNVLEVTEYYDGGGVHLTPVFGDYIPARQG